MVVTAVVMVLAWTGPGQAYEVTGDVTSGWGTEGGNLWYDVLKETATSSAGGYDGTYIRGVIVRPPTTSVSPNSVNPTNHNWIEVDYILVTGRDGQRVLYSVGELDPRFGNETVTLTLTKNKRDYDLTGGGRSVRNVSKIDVVHAFTNIKGVPNHLHSFSPLLIVSSAGIISRTYDLADLQGMTQNTFDASSSTTNTVGIWTGPTLLDVLKASGINTRDMDSYIVVRATDGYATLLSMYEAIQLTSAQYALLAISDKGGTINCRNACSNGDNGLARLVLPSDIAAGRWVSNVAQIVVYKLEECSDH